jgi:hypothetical protein
MARPLPGHPRGARSLRPPAPPPQHRLALEATFNTWAIVAILQPLVSEVVVSNPLQTRAIAQAKVKTDMIDTDVLAHLLRCNYLPRVWIPAEQTRQLRQQCTERANLSSDRTRLKNRIHAVLHQRLIEAPHGDLFSPATCAGCAPSRSMRPAAPPSTVTCASSTPSKPRSSASPMNSCAMLTNTPR